MSISGKVISVSPDWRGSTLAVMTATTDTVLTVDDAVDFDEDGGRLVIADESTPREYVSVDEDANTVTLAVAVGAVFDDTEPVVVWDPTVGASGARVREDVAMVMLPDSEQVVMATLKHEQIPTAGVYSLVGATVLIEDEDPDDETSDWYVASVVGRAVVTSVQTTPDVLRGIEIDPSQNDGYGSLTAFNNLGEPTFNLNGQTGDLDALGTLRSVAANGTAVSMQAIANPFQTNQSWALINFTTALVGWDDGLIWSFDDGANGASLRISSPHNPAAPGDPFFKSALLDLRAEGDGATKASLYADTLELLGNTFDLRAANATPIDFNVYGTTQVKFRHDTGVGHPQIRLVFDTATEPGIQSWDTGTGNRLDLEIQGKNLLFDMEGASRLAMFAGAGLPWMGRADGATGIAYGPNRTISMDWVGFRVPHEASSFPIGSDRAYKDNIRPIPGGALDTIRALLPSVYTLRSTGEETRGLVAQDVLLPLPCAVSGDEGSYSVDPYPILTTAIAAIQELAQQVDALRSRR